MTALYRYLYIWRWWLAGSALFCKRGGPFKNVNDTPTAPLLPPTHPPLPPPGCDAASAPLPDLTYTAEHIYRATAAEHIAILM